MRHAWAHRAPPAPGRRGTAAWHGRPASAAELTGMRVELRAVLRSGGLLLRTDEDGEHLLLLVFEELVSNGLRYGRLPVDVTLTAADGGWLLEVSDGAPDRAPVPAVDRDAAEGGMGLDLVARLCGAHGWAVVGERKVVWASVGLTPSPLTPERFLAATNRSRALGARLTEMSQRLTVTSMTIAATRDRLAVRAAAGGRPDAAGRHRTAAQRARQAARQARRMALPAA